ncbi:FG-GAP repeat domain-containing protein, partial [Actinomadura adrarensis]
DANRQQPQLAFGDFAFEPVHDRGIAGVVVADFDADGWDDMYVTNGPGRANSLFMNRRGRGFTDVAQRGGSALIAQDSSGACAGDVDNDGRVDLYVLGKNSANRLLRNLGHGRFADITDPGVTAAGTRSHNSCTMGDFNGDGRLDIAIANSFDLHNALPIIAVPYALNQRNQLLQNVDGRRFTDVSDSSGFAHIEVDPKDVPPDQGQAPLADISWSVSAIDIDQNGTQDLVVANDQAAVPMRKYGGVNRGLLRVYRNNGKGRFTDVTQQVGTNHPGAWMGLAFGDFNFDGTVDIFSGNGGDYMFLPLPEMGIKTGDLSSRWFLQRKDGTFADPRDSSLADPVKQGADPTLGGIGANPWAWGSSAFDYNNDGYTDIFYHGSMDGMTWVTADNPGALLRNNGPRAMRKGLYPSFSFDPSFARSGKDQRKRTVTGVAVGDFTHSGFSDIVSVAQSIKQGALTPYSSERPFDFDSPFDEDASFLKTYERIGGGPAVPSILLRPTGAKTTDGDLSVAR